MPHDPGSGPFFLSGQPGNQNDTDAGPEENRCGENAGPDEDAENGDAFAAEVQPTHGS